MSKPIIEVRNISKRYQLGAIGATRLRDDLERIWDRITGKAARKNTKEFWAVRDVSFEVQPGEIIGIIGRNGAGKSTLLKILSRITEPTSGEIVMRGRVASLLEVGTGFHGDLTGRENIFLNGAILGMTKSEIRSKLDEIIAFAEIEKFIDTPVKRYSSGMYVRLAFAVAAHLQSEILILDEVLAVGDYAFQAKCLKKMKEVSASGRTLLFVSHNTAAVSDLCSHGIYLASGTTKCHGKISTVLKSFLREHVASTGKAEYTNESLGSLKKPTLRSVQLINDDGEVTNRCSVRSPFKIEVRYAIPQITSLVDVGLKIRSLDGRAIFTTHLIENIENNKVIPNFGEFTATVEFPSEFIVPGNYRVHAALHQPGEVIFDQHESALEFEISDTGTSYSRYGNYAEIGVVMRKLPWHLKSS